MSFLSSDFWCKQVSFPPFSISLNLKFTQPFIHSFRKNFIHTIFFLIYIVWQQLNSRRTNIWFDVRSKSYQCHQVPGVFAAEVSTAAEDDERHEEDCIGHIICPWITSHKVLGIFDKGEDSNKGQRDRQLRCKNHEDLVGKRSKTGLRWDEKNNNNNNNNARYSE